MGGIVRAVRDTDPLNDATDHAAAGWRTVVNGISDADVEFSEDMRTVTFELKLTNGKSAIAHGRIPTVIHRGVYREADDYSQGDSVTHAGSTWILQTERAAGSPGSPMSGWVLSVKKGRDGKDGKDGERGPQGERGDPGRDLTQSGFDGRKW